MKKAPLVIFIIAYIVILIIQILLFRYPKVDLTSLIPGPAAFDFFWLVTLQPLYLIVVYLLFGDLMTMIYYPLHKLIRLFKYEYKNIEMGTEFSIIDYFLRLAIPALLCYSLLFMISGFIPSDLFDFSRETVVLTEIALNFLFLPISCIAVSGSWILDDMGIMCHKKPKYYNIRKPLVIEGVGRLYYSTWIGLISYTTPIGIAIQIYRTLTLHIPWQSTIILILLPLIMMAMLIPVVLINDAKIEKKKRKIY